MNRKEGIIIKGGIKDEIKDEDKDMVIANLSENLPVLRAKLNMSQEDLSKKLGVSRQTIINFEQRKGNVSWSLVMAVLLLFLVNPLTSGLVFGLGIVNNAIIKYLGMSSIASFLKNMGKKGDE